MPRYTIPCASAQNKANHYNNHNICVMIVIFKFFNSSNSIFFIILLNYNASLLVKMTDEMQSNRMAEMEQLPCFLFNDSLFVLIIFFLVCHNSRCEANEIMGLIISECKKRKTETKPINERYISSFTGV